MPVSPSPAAPADQAAGRAILFVEDHPDTARTMARLLARLGYRVRTAGSVAEGLAAAKEERFDLLVSDIGLPDDTGLDLMRAIQAVHPLRGIALTGYGRDEDVRRSREAGFVAHVTEPVDLARLERVIDEALSGRPAGAELQRY